MIFSQPDIRETNTRFPEKIRPEQLSEDRPVITVSKPPVHTLFHGTGQFASTLLHGFLPGEKAHLQKVLLLQPGEVNRQGIRNRKIEFISAKDIRLQPLRLLKHRGKGIVNIKIIGIAEADIPASRLPDPSVSGLSRTAVFLLPDHSDHWVVPRQRQRTGIRVIRGTVIHKQDLHIFQPLPLQCPDAGCNVLPCLIEWNNYR